MPFIPHSTQETTEMLAAIQHNSLAELFSEIPGNLRIHGFPNLPSGFNEMEAGRFFREKAQQDPMVQCFIGAGAYDHHIPAAVWDIVSRGEWMTAYTPYQAEASQGTLQLLWEYQTMMAGLMALEVSNASLYDGATALAEAALMSLRLQQHTPGTMRILIPDTLHPHYRAVLNTVLKQHAVELLTVAHDFSGRTSVDEWKRVAGDAPVTAIIIPQPNFFGCLEEADALTNWANSLGALVIGVVNPLAMALLKPPGQWGESGADIACGDGQPLGIPLSSGGPYFGFITCKMAHVRQMPGRIVGRTRDGAGKTGFTLTLQAREQHIRRAKATSNICTNQGLLVTAGTIYMSLLGPVGLRRVALQCHQNSANLRKLVTERLGLSWRFEYAIFHEQILMLPVSADKVVRWMAKRGIDAGLSLANYFDGSANDLLVCVTETKTEADLNAYVDLLALALQSIQSGNE